MNEPNAKLLAIPFQVSETEYDLILVLKDINIKRITSYDPCTIPTEEIANKFPDLKLRMITIAYATEAEIQQIIDGRRLGKSLGETLDILARGYEDHPEQGDGGPVRSILPPGRG